MMCYADAISQALPSASNLMTDERSSYISYMLRLWRVNEAGASLWRASLEDPHTGKRMGFADLEGLFTFLRRQLDLAGSDPSQIPDVRE